MKNEIKEMVAKNIEEQAKEFFKELVDEMKRKWPDKICSTCGAVNCHFNETCIKCNCQL